MFGPLLFGAGETGQLKKSHEFTLCPLCDLEFFLPEEQEKCLSHIYEHHKLIIADADKIPFMDRYLNYWRGRLYSGLKQYCSTMLVDVKKGDVIRKGEEFYLLSDVCEEDKAIRSELQKQFLEEALEQQKFEREDNSFSHGCLFCRLTITPTRAEYLNHLSLQHNMQLGKPDNVVYVDRLISLVESKMESLQCIFCEKFFKDRNVLKEHMRKKGHKRINPDNRLYDQFFIINYSDTDGYFRRIKGRKDSIECDETADWSDWEEVCKISIVCLFCEESRSAWEEITNHMVVSHNFNYERNTKKLNFYEQVKLVNYIRTQVYKNKCITCGCEVSSKKELLNHMENENHLLMPGKPLWDQPEYFFPTYENDSFLCQIEDYCDDTDSELSDQMSDVVISDEQAMLPTSVLSEL